MALDRYPSGTGPDSEEGTSNRNCQGSHNAAIPCEDSIHCHCAGTPDAPEYSHENALVANYGNRSCGPSRNTACAPISDQREQLPSEDRVGVDECLGTARDVGRAQPLLLSGKVGVENLASPTIRLSASRRS
jgi:hypothetical protein